MTASISSENYSFLHHELTNSHTYNLEKEVGLTLVTGGAGFKGSHIVDKLLIEKLNKKKLEVLGDGRQSKSYIYIIYCIECIFFCL